MGISLATVSQVLTITTAVVTIGTTVYNFIEQKIIKKKRKVKTK